MAPAQRVKGTETVLDAIGNTPLVRIDGVWVKLEYLNPSGSIKARIATYIIERAEAEGLLRPGDTIVEASSGNTGNAMSMVAAVKGYQMLVVMPNGLSQERTAISRAFGAEVMAVGDFHVNDALATVREIGSRPGYFAPQQFDNEWNVEENRTWLGQEILDQLPVGVLPDAVVGGVGTGGTIVGVGQRFKEANPDCLVVAMEPDESCTILCGEIGKHLIEGIADGDTLHPVQQAFHECHALQCGFCTPGMIMQSIDLINENPDPSEQEIREGLEGNLCRCTGYQNIVQAVRTAATATAGARS